ncbi:YifB family Mg chelatase-like AAA ATPase [Sulfurospirillum sp. 1612]|uniref:YifB family Mg chelatase-like AAA ATPase n=1 Tax=Sulfurospirillum sp. 1612 TaxID=3094835 RepID=UPI002F929778
MAKKIFVESTFIRALPGFSIVGMANQSIQESKDRIKSSLLSIGFKFPAQKITVNLSPSDIKKEGSHFDLVIALLIAFQNSDISCRDFFIFGELGLDGKVKSTSAIFPLLLSLARQYETLNVLLPHDMMEKASQIKGLKIYGVETLHDAMEFFAQKRYEAPYIPIKVREFFDEKLTIGGKEYFYDNPKVLDFKEVHGHRFLKRALVICAAGMHNILLEGSPGSGKSMSIKRLRDILPPVTIEEVLETQAYHAINYEDDNLSAKRAFRSPHHSSSKPSIFGGGSAKAMAGEAALAHNGILFFDELPHFSKQILESLREPLENHKVLISRVQNKIEYDTKFLFAAAQNPCPCGNLLSKVRECRCSDLEVARYKSRISDPILDRIDLYIQVDEEFSKEETESSHEMFQKVLRAFIFQKNRGQRSLNAHLDEQEIKRYCTLSATAQETLDMAIGRYGLNQRSVSKVLKISRTIADIDEKESIERTHLLEALSFRKR